MSETETEKESTYHPSSTSCDTTPTTKPLAVKKVSSKIVKAIVKKAPKISKASKATIARRNLQKVPSMDPAARYTCKYCCASYITSYQLGGHTSRAHPGISKEFTLKKQIRDRRQPIREAHKQAKLLFTIQNPELNPSEHRFAIKKL